LTELISQKFILGSWEIDPLGGTARGPGNVSRHLEPKVMDVLRCLAAEPNQLVTRLDLTDAVWLGKPGSDEQLSRAISELRRLFGDDRSSPKYIETVPKRGYRLLAEVRAASQGSNGRSSFRAFLLDLVPWRRSAVLAMTILVFVSGYMAYWLQAKEGDAISSSAHLTENSKAYASYLNARVSYDEGRLLNAEQLLHEAVRFDPRFAEAYELLAATYWRLAGETISAIEGQQSMRTAAAQALDVDPDLAFARVLFEIGDSDGWTYATEVQALEKAVSSGSANVDVMNALSWDLLVLGYFDEARRYAEVAIDADPTSWVAHNRLAESLYASGRYDEAEQALLNVDRLVPGEADYQFGIRRLLSGNDAEATRYFESSMADYVDRNLIKPGELIAGGRDPQSGRQFLDRRIPEIVAAMPSDEAYAWDASLTEFYLYLGFLDRYFEKIEAVIHSTAGWTDAEVLVQLGTINRQTDFTAHPKYLEVARALGVIDVWEQRGPPDFCRLDEGEWACE
jgi:DNA-binding winged helix-turn-helix (wHTH) protein/Flp pilus assembly protein TadD